jgi:pimeloyl-ACP methyl ester carboxylesterase
MIRKLTIPGAAGKISALLQRPEGSASCPLVILMHGFMANKTLEPLKSLADRLEEEGIASLRFDFDGHGKSDGRFVDMTVLTELEDAQRVFAFARGLDFVTDIALAGHSQGGVVAGMLAGELKDQVRALVQLAPAAVLRDDALKGELMGRKYDPADPPRRLFVLFHYVGRSYFQVAQTLPIYEVSACYQGPVCLIHGKNDRIVPFQYSEKYHGIYADSELHLLEGENHFLSKKRPEVIRTAVSFLKRHLR